MVSWCVELCRKGTKWYWVCRNVAGSFVCQSKRMFDTDGEARRDFERQLEDHLAVMRCRFVK